MDKKEYIQSKIRDIKDFPKEGIIFKDITPLLMDVKGVEYVIDLLVENLGGQKVDKVVGMESRGFFFGMLLAQRLGAGFVPVRKKGKLPYKTLSQTYDLEYGQDVLEIHEDAIAIYFYSCKYRCFYLSDEIFKKLFTILFYKALTINKNKNPIFVIFLLRQ